MYHTLYRPSNRVPASAWDEFDSLFRAFSRAPVANTLRVNVRSSEADVQVSAALPGYQNAEVQIDVKDEVLSIVAEPAAAPESSETPKAEEAAYVLREFAPGRLERHLALGFTPAEDAISATLKDGILTVTVKRPTAAKARKIVVQ